jgi:hypothetical protein
MTRSVPVIEAARGDTRKAMRSATSLGFAGPPMSVALENDKPKRLTFQRAATPPPFLGHSHCSSGFVRTRSKGGSCMR